MPISLRIPSTNNPIIASEIFTQIPLRIPPEMSKGTPPRILYMFSTRFFLKVSFTTSHRIFCRDSNKNFSKDSSKNFKEISQAIQLEKLAQIVKKNLSGIYFGSPLKIISCDYTSYSPKGYSSKSTEPFRNSISQKSFKGFLQKFF